MFIYEGAGERDFSAFFAKNIILLRGEMFFSLFVGVGRSCFDGFCAYRWRTGATVTNANNDPYRNAQADTGNEEGLMDHGVYT